MISAELKSLIEALRFDIKAHLNGSYKLIAQRYDDVYAGLLIFNEYENRNIRITFNFWDGWCDASNRDWLVYKEIKKEDWPILAEEIIDCLENKKEIINATIVNNFAPENTPGFFSKLKKIILG
jgi:hypothetical protein